MPKPVLVVSYCIQGLSMSQVIANLRSVKEVVEKSGATEEYYTFVLPVTTDSTVQVFYEKDLEETSYKELKDLITKKLDSFEKNPELKGNAAELYPYNVPKKRSFWTKWF